jgi:hypothetical protein
MHWAQIHDERIYTYRVVTDNDIVGYGENYSRPAPSPYWTRLSRNGVKREYAPLRFRFHVLCLTPAR